MLNLLFSLSPLLLCIGHRCFNFLQRARLTRIQHDVLRRQDFLARIRVAFGNFIRDGNQAAIFEFANGGRRGFRQRDKFRQQNLPPLLNDVPNFELTLGKFGKFSDDWQRANKQPLAPTRVLMAHGFGQHGLECDLRRAAVIVRNPARELEDFGRHERLCADDFENGFESRVRRFLRHRRNDAENFPRAERNLYPTAHVHLAHQFRRDGVIELLAEGYFESDASNHPREVQESRPVSQEAATHLCRQSCGAKFFPIHRFGVWQGNDWQRNRSSPFRVVRSLK